MTTRTQPARSRRTSREAAEHRVQLLTRVVGIVVGLLAVALVVSVALTPQPRASDAVASDVPLPNPMGGPAQHAPVATGAAVAFGGLEVVAPDVAMGDVPLNVTMVSTWEVVNPTGDDLAFTVGQPQVHEGCCPGPVVVDETALAPGDTVTLAPGDVALVQFPLQMHPGMDGPHHLTVPLGAGDELAELHVTGNFTSEV